MIALVAIKVFHTEELCCTMMGGTDLRLQLKLGPLIKKGIQGDQQVSVPVSLDNNAGDYHYFPTTVMHISDLMYASHFEKVHASIAKNHCCTAI